MVSARLTARLIKPTTMIDNARARVLRLFQSDHDNRTRGHELILRERVDVRDIGIFFTCRCPNLAFSLGNRHRSPVQHFVFYPKETNRSRRSAHSATYCRVG